jgi:prevent-host-death family protein
MTTVNIHEAKTHFSKLVDAAMEGETIIIAKAGKPVAMLTPITKNPPKRTFGLLKSKIRIASDFDAPLPKDLLSDFEG